MAPRGGAVLIFSSDWKSTIFSAAAWRTICSCTSRASRITSSAMKPPRTSASRRGWKTPVGEGRWRGRCGGGTDLLTRKRMLHG
jgi:hypothetical protein